jgi:HK97 family phage prohead protease
MNVRYRQVPFKIKQIDKTGEFSGYLSVFGNTDAYRDVVMPGAFDDSLAQWATEDALPPCLWQHGSDDPIGPFTKIVPDEKGLYCEGELILDMVSSYPVCPKAHLAYVMAEKKVVRGMSIGYTVNPGGETYDGKMNVNRLTSLNLMEGSFVTFPANVEAVITDVKSRFVSGDLPSLKEFESSLRDALSCSRDDAHVIATRGFVKLLELRDADKKQIDVENDVDSVLAAIRTFCHASHPV